MIPLTMAEQGEKNIIKQVKGRGEVHKHLEDLGFVAGAEVTVVNIMNGNPIVNIKGTRVGISKELAMKIMV